MNCKFNTILDRECGRPATYRVWWEQCADVPCQQLTAELELPVCEVHRDLQLAELVLSCQVGEIRLLTLDAGTPVPFDALTGSPTLTRIAVALTEAP